MFKTDNKINVNFDLDETIKYITRVSILQRVATGYDKIKDKRFFEYLSEGCIFQCISETEDGWKEFKVLETDDHLYSFSYFDSEFKFFIDNEVDLDDRVFFNKLFKELKDDLEELLLNSRDFFGGYAEDKESAYAIVCSRLIAKYAYTKKLEVIANYYFYENMYYFASINSYAKKIDMNVNTVNSIFKRFRQDFIKELSYSNWYE